MKKYRILNVLFPAIFLSACASSSSPPSPAQAPEPEQKLPTTNSSVIVSWSFTPGSQPRTYSSIRTTVIAQTDAPITRRDSVTSQMLYSIGLTRSLDNLFFSGSISSFEVIGPVAEPDAQLKLPIAFSGQIKDHILSARVSDKALSESGTRCDDFSLTPLNTVQHNIVLLPLKVSNAETWSDSTSSVVCSGILPITITMVRTFHLVGEGNYTGIPALIIDKKERTFSKGEGSQGQHRIFIESHGTTTSQIYVDQKSGELLSAKSTNQTSLSIQSSGRNQHFSESSTETTQLRQ